RFHHHTRRLLFSLCAQRGRRCSWIPAAIRQRRRATERCPLLCTTPDRLYIRLVRGCPRFAAGYLHVDGMGPPRSDRHLGILSTASGWKQKQRSSRTMDFFCVRPGPDVFDPALFLLSLVL